MVGLGLGLAAGPSIASSEPKESNTYNTRITRNTRVAETEDTNNDDSANNTPGIEDATEDGNDTDSDRTQIDACTVIDEPGEYELVTDLKPTMLDHSGCIVVDAEDVTIHGNGHTIDLTDVDRDSNQPFRGAGIDINPDARPDHDWNTTVTGVVIRGGNAGIKAQLDDLTNFSEITAIENNVGLSYHVASGDLDNCVLKHNNTGIRLDGDDVFGGSNLRIEHSTIQDNGGRGIIVVNDSGARVNNTRIVGNGRGITVGEFSVGAITTCHICRNTEYGIQGLTEPGDDDEEPRQASIEAMNNYWGAGNGPSSFGDPDSPFTDPSTGRPADGDGDAISEGLDPGVSNVRFDPFFESVIDGVGADH